MDKFWSNIGIFRKWIGCSVLLWSLAGRPLTLELVFGNVFGRGKGWSKGEVRVADFWVVCDKISAGLDGRNSP